MERSGFTVEENSPLLPYYRRFIWEPSLRVLPESVHPNTISLTNHVVCWGIFAAGAIAPMLTPNRAFAARLLAGLLVFISMVLDALDGMQARLYGRTSRLGEVLDHWLDAINTSLTTAGLVMTLGLDGWLAVGAIHVANMLYNSQLVLYHHTGRFVHTPTSGVDAQMAVSISFVIIAFLYWFWPHAIPWDQVKAAYAIIGIAVSLRVASFYYRRLGALVLHHLKFVVMGFLIGLLHAAGAISVWAMVFWLRLLAFRVTGGFVLHTVLDTRYDGFDRISAFWLGVLVTLGIIAQVAVADFRPWFEVVAFVAALHLALANAYDLVTAMPQLHDGD